MPSPTLKYAVSYKKKDGTLSIPDDKKTVVWSQSDGTPVITITTTDITNLQQTPATSARVALKVFVGEEGHVFSFTNKENARSEADAVTASLRTVLAAKSLGVAAQLAPTRTPTPAQNGAPAQPAAMAIAKAVAAKTDDDAWYDDGRLKNDIDLQRSLLAADKPLNERFQQALRDKPESVSGIQFTAQFWSTRIHLLRAHAIEKAQKQGEYNVLPDIKYTITPGLDGREDTKHINITKDQIRLIFKQYPVVRQAFNETVPPWRNEQFWEHFFASRLLKKLKGFPLAREDPVDSKLDKYLDHQDAGPRLMGQIPRFIDLEGNEQNHSQKGNRPDMEMRESAFDQPILHTLNRLSDKLLSHVAAEQGEAHAPIGMDESTFEELRLRDLAMEDADNRIVLNVNEKQRYVGAPEEDDLSADARKYAKQDPKKVLSSLKLDLKPSNLGSDEKGTLRLDRAIGFQSDDDDSDTEMSNGQTNGQTSKKRVRIGSHAAVNAASASIISSISSRREAASSDPHSLHGISQTNFDTLTITHNTTTEFLHYFWSLFLSGDASKSSELAQLVTTLDRSIDRINVVGEQADKERNDKIDRMKAQVREYYERTGKRRKLDESAVTGGKSVVDVMVKPTVEALAEAARIYRKAFEQQTKEAAAAAAVSGV